MSLAETPAGRAEARFTLPCLRDRTDQVHTKKRKGTNGRKCLNCFCSAEEKTKARKNEALRSRRRVAVTSWSKSNKAVGNRSDVHSIIYTPFFGPDRMQIQCSKTVGSWFSSSALSATFVSRVMGVQPRDRLQVNEQAIRETPTMARNSGATTT